MILSLAEEFINNPSHLPHRLYPGSKLLEAMAHFKEDKRTHQACPI